MSERQGERCPIPMGDNGRSNLHPYEPPPLIVVGVLFRRMRSCPGS